MNHGSFQLYQLGNTVPFSIGLQNINSSTCYANSILNCLFQINKVLYSLGGVGMMQLNSIQDNEINILTTFHKLINANFDNEVDNSRRQINRFMDFINKKALNQFRAGQQNDAQEFLTYLKQWLEDELRYVATQFHRPGIDMRNLRIDANNGLELLGQLSVLIQEKRTCMRGHQSIIRVNEMLHLPIENCNNTINSCLEKYFSNDHLSCVCSGNFHNQHNNNCNVYNCGQCGTYVNAICSKHSSTARYFDY